MYVYLYTNIILFKTKIYQSPVLLYLHKKSEISCSFILNKTEINQYLFIDLQVRSTFNNLIRNRFMNKVSIYVVKNLDITNFRCLFI